MVLDDSDDGGVRGVSGDGVRGVSVRGDTGDRSEPRDGLIGRSEVASDKEAEMRPDILTTSATAATGIRVGPGENRETETALVREKVNVERESEVVGKTGREEEVREEWWKMTKGEGKGEGEGGSEKVEVEERGGEGEGEDDVSDSSDDEDLPSYETNTNTKVIGEYMHTKIPHIVYHLHTYNDVPSE